MASDVWRDGGIRGSSSLRDSVFEERFLITVIVVIVVKNGTERLRSVSALFDATRASGGEKIVGIIGIIGTVK